MNDSLYHLKYEESRHTVQRLTKFRVQMRLTECNKKSHKQAEYEQFRTNLKSPVWCQNRNSELVYSHITNPESAELHSLKLTESRVNRVVRNGTILVF